MDEATAVLTRLGIAEAGSRKRVDGRGGRRRQTIRLAQPNPPNTANPEGEPRSEQERGTAPPTSGDAVFWRVHEHAQDPPGVWRVWSASAGADAQAGAAEDDADGGQLGMFDA